MRVLLTGSSGHLAQHVAPLLGRRGHTVVSFDLPKRDITDEEQVNRAARDADACIHLAGMKYADRGEREPLEAVDINVNGTANIIRAFGPNAVIASTCKAADPETVYGCSKLIAERLALAAGARVVRFVNVLGSAGSVTDIWDAIPPSEPLPVCDATRLFISGAQAAKLAVNALDWPTGRYAPANTTTWHMTELASQLYAGRETVMVPLRRGDRQRERLLAECERAQAWIEGTAMRIVGQHDPATGITVPSTFDFASLDLAA